MVSDIAGVLVPYGGWAKLSTKIPAFERSLARIGAAETAPFATGAARTAARFLPLEAARVGGNAVFGDQPNSEMVTSALVNESLAGALGGAGEWLASAGRRNPKLKDILPGVDTDKPTPLLLRNIQEQLAAAPPDKIPLINNVMGRLKDYARAEEKPVGERYVSLLEGDKDPKGVNRLFSTADETGRGPLRRRRLIISDRDFSDEANWRTAASDASLPAEFESKGQYFRHLSFANEKLAKATDNTLTTALRPIGDNWLMAREADDGLFVMAKKINGRIGKAQPTDEWMLFKTDKPGEFATGQERWAQAVFRRNAWAGEPAPEADGGAIFNATRDFQKQFPYHNYQSIAGDGSRGLSKLGQRLRQYFGVTNPNADSSEALSRAADFFRTYFAPGMFQFSKSPRAAYVMGNVRAAQDAANTIVDNMMFGQHKVPLGANFYYESVRSAKAFDMADALWKKIDDAPQQVVEELWNLWRKRASPAEAEAMFADPSTSRLSKQTIELYRELHTTKQAIDIETAKAEKALGLSKSKPEDSTLGIAREFEGDLMIALRDQGGKIKALASGVNGRQAQARAAKMLSDNPTWHKAEEFSLTDQARIPKDLLPAQRDPSFLRRQTDIAGYRWDMVPWTKKELQKAVEENLRRRINYVSEKVGRNQMQEQLARLAAEDPATYNIVSQRMGDVYGHQRPVGKLINSVVDAGLAPILGTNSASKIARTSNELVWHFTLGGLGNLGYVIANAVTPIQTVLPEIAYVLNAVPERLAPYYSHFAAGGTKGPTGILNVLDPLKFMRRAAGEMAKPSEELRAALERATNERVIEPKIYEDFIGENAVKITDMKRAFKTGPGGFVDWLRAVSEFLPANSERFSRVYAFTTGHALGRDFLNLRGPELYQFAKQFTNKTMYLYGTADRPAIFTGPGGTMLGLFKNWMMHYLFTMGQYTGEAWRGNWAPLMWQQAGTWAVGGLAASPFYHAASAFNNMFSDKTLIENTYNNFGEAGSDGIFYGLPALLSSALPMVPSVSISSQTTMPGVNPQRDAEQMFSFAIADRLNYLKRALGAAMDEWQTTGNHPAASSDVRDMLIRGFAPKTIYKFFQAFEDEGVKSMASGHPLVKDFSPVDKALFAMGLNPTLLDRTYKVNDILQHNKDLHAKEVSRLGRAYAEAMGRQDTDGMLMILKKATFDGIGAASVLKSASARYRADNRDLIERNFGSDTWLRFQKVLGQ